MSAAIEKYLALYAEPTLPGPSRDKFAHVVVVPACGEEEESLHNLFTTLAGAALRSGSRALVCLVVNESPATAPAYRAINERVVRKYRTSPEVHGDTLRIEVLDHTAQNAFVQKQGVGLARKIGADFALRCIHHGSVTSPWIHTTDADARVAADYFELRPISPRWGLGPLAGGAFVHPFTHTREGEWGARTARYETYLRYYCRGLAFAGSPFAFATVGSTLSFSAAAYAQVRGFPKKEAGEDFYFLHKVAKVAHVYEGGGPVTLTARPSDRVPFGTGQSVRRIAELESLRTAYTVYHPAIFVALRRWVRAMRRMSEGMSWAQACSELGPERGALLAMGADRQSEVIHRTRPTCEARQRHWHTWFDGFRTLRFIHLLRETHHPSLPLEDALVLSTVLWGRLDGLTQGQEDGEAGAATQLGMHLDLSAVALDKTVGDRQA